MYKKSCQYLAPSMEVAKHYHECPICKKRISGTGETLCPECSMPKYPKQNFSRDLDMADKQRMDKENAR